MSALLPRPFRWSDRHRQPHPAFYILHSQSEQPAPDQYKAPLVIGQDKTSFPCPICRTYTSGSLFTQKQPFLSGTAVSHFICRNRQGRFLWFFLGTARDGSCGSFCTIQIRPGRFSPPLLPSSFSLLPLSLLTSQSLRPLSPRRQRRKPQRTAPRSGRAGRPHRRLERRT